MTAPAKFSPRSRYGRGRFHSRTAGYQMKRAVYACTQCPWHTEEGKVRECQECAGTMLEHFDSRAEFLRFRELQLMQQAGVISRLEAHPRFPIAVAHSRTGQPVKGCTYVADFAYLDRKGQKVIEDIKPRDEAGQSEVFRLKRRLFEAAYDITITIVGR